METLLQDLRYAVRQLIKTPGFTAVAVITLALGVGANAAIYSVANWMLLRPVPGVAAPSELAVVQLWYSEAERTSSLAMSYPQYFDFAKRVQKFSGVTAIGYATGITVLSTGSGDPVGVEVAQVGYNYFDVLGVRMVAGRAFSREEELDAAAAPVGVMSHGIWTSMFGSDSTVVGRALTINGQPVRIVGVSGRGFNGDELLTKVDFWIPPLAGRAVTHTMIPYAVNDPRNTQIRQVIARRRPGVSVSAAEIEVASVLPQVMRDNPRPDTGPETTFSGRLFEGIGMAVTRREGAVRAVRLLLGTSGLLILICCANLANVLIFRASGRREEVAVRRALGAGWWRVARQQLTEGAVLSVVAGAVAVLLSFWFVGVLKGPLLPFMEVPQDVRPDARVIGFALLASLVTGLVATLAPLSGGARDVAEGLKHGSKRVTARRAYLRGGLAVVQLAVSLTLMIGAFLMVGTLRNLRSVDVGFDPRHITTFSLDLKRVGYADEAVDGVLVEIERRLEGTPGIEAVATALYPPFGRVSFMDRVKPGDASNASQPVQVVSNQVTPGYFSTLGIPLKSGRPFDDADVAASRAAGPRGQTELPVIVNELLARQAFGSSEAAVGQIISGVSRAGTVTRPYRVIGVAKDSRWLGFAEEAGPFVYRPPHSLGSSLGSQFLVRSNLDAVALESAIRSVLKAVGPTLIPMRVTGLNTLLANGIAEQWVFGKVLVALSGLAVLLASIGLYGLVAFSVAERTREFGIRLALGAEAARLVKMVLRQGGLLVAIGIPFGIAGAVGLSRFISSKLFGLTPVEPLLYGAAATLLIVVVLAACLLPARAASRVDPIVALRSE